MSTTFDSVIVNIAYYVSLFCLFEYSCLNEPDSRDGCGWWWCGGGGVGGGGDAGQRKIEMSNRNQRQILIDAENHRDSSTLAVLTDQ